MSFLSNDAINRVNVHAAIQALAQGAGGVFVLVFLLKAGVSIPLTLLAQAAIDAGRFSIRPALLPLAKNVGLKPMLIFGTVALAVQYPVLAEVHGVGPTLAVFCLVASMAEVFYWISLNATFSTLGDAENRGRQVGVREALVAVAGVVAPLLGASALVTFGPRAAFAVAAIIQVLAVFPLLGLPAIPVKPRAAGVFRVARPAILLAAIDGWFDTIFLLFWQIGLFITLHGSFASYGGAMALAGLVGAGCGLILGHHVDRGRARHAVLVAFGVLAAVALLRAVSLGSPQLALVANASGALAMTLISPVLSITSNLAKASPCPLRFHLGTEAGWDVGSFAACLCAAELIRSGAPLSTVSLLALPATAASVLVLWRLYAPKAVIAS